MTSNTTPSGVCSASSSYGTTPPWKAFDRTSINGWVNNGGTAWIQYEFTENKKIYKYRMSPLNYDVSDLGRFPKDCRLLGSNTGSFSGEEVAVDTRTGLSAPDHRTQEFVVSNPGEFLYYRLDISVNNGDGYTGISELELLGGVGFQIDTTSVTNGEAPDKVYLKSTFENDFSVIKNISAKFEFANISRPEKVKYSNMVAADASLATADSTYVDYSPWNGFDGDISGSGNTMWANAETGVPSWLMREFTSGIKFNSIELCGSVNSVQSPTAFKIQGSNNGTIFDTLLSVSGQSWTSLEVKSYVIANPGNYSYYRIYITANAAGNYVTVTNLDFYSEEIDILTTTELIKNGDNLVIVKDDDSVHEVVASGVDTVGCDILKDNSSIMYYTFDSTIKNECNENNAIWQQNPVYTDGKINTSAYFDGTNGIDLTHTIALSGLSSLSISFFASVKNTGNFIYDGW